MAVRPASHFDQGAHSKHDIADEGDPDNIRAEKRDRCNHADRAEKREHGNYQQRSKTPPYWVRADLWLPPFAILPAAIDQNDKTAAKIPRELDDSDKKTNGNS
jgi:hypothetical protein